MGRPRTLTYDECCKTMRGDHLKRHMKKHVGEMKNFDEAETHRSGTCGEMKNVDEAETHRSGTSSVSCG